MAPRNDDITLEMIRRNWMILAAFVSVIASGSVGSWQLSELGRKVEKMEEPVALIPLIREDLKQLKSGLRLVPRGVTPLPDETTSADPIAGFEWLMEGEMEN